MNDSERTIMRSRVHWGVFLLPVLMTVLPLIPFAFLVGTILVALRQIMPTLPISILALLPMCAVSLPGLVSIGLAAMSFRKGEVVITNRRLSFSTGVLFRISGELPLTKIESVFVLEPLFGRMFGYGTVIVVGTGGTPVPLRYLPKPQHFREQLKTTIELCTRPVATPTSSRVAQDDSRYMPKG